MRGTLEGRAVGLGAAVALAVAVPSALLSLAAGPGSSLVFPLFTAVLVGFVIGGFVAGRQAPTAPFSNGGVAALVAFAIVQAVGALRRTLGDEPVSITQIVFSGLLAYASGVLGGVIASKVAERRTRRGTP